MKRFIYINTESYSLLPESFSGIRKMAGILGCLCILLANQPSSFGQSGFTQRGSASYFADNRGGKITALGSKYDMFSFCAAHAALKPGSRVKVTNLDNGKETIVEIVDKYSKDDRIITLSFAAAKALGMLGEIYTDVKIEMLPALPKAKKPVAKKPVARVVPRFVSGEIYRPTREMVSLKGYGLQVASFHNWDAAVKEAKVYESFQLTKVYIQYSRLDKKNIFRVLLGVFETFEQAEAGRKFLHLKKGKYIIRKY